MESIPAESGSQQILPPKSSRVRNWKYSGSNPGEDSWRKANCWRESKRGRVRNKTPLGNPSEGNKTILPKCISLNMFNLKDIIWRHRKINFSLTLLATFRGFPVHRMFPGARMHRLIGYKQCGCTVPWRKLSAMSSCYIFCTTSLDLCTVKFYLCLRLLNLYFIDYSHNYAHTKYIFSDSIIPWWS